MRRSERNSINETSLPHLTSAIGSKTFSDTFSKLADALIVLLSGGRKMEKLGNLGIE